MVLVGWRGGLLTQISLAEFLENLDVFRVIYFFVTAFFKMTLYIFAAVRSIQILTMQVTSHRLIIPVCMVVLFVGITMADNIMEHIMGVHMKNFSPYLWVPMLLVLPGLLLVTALISKGVGEVVNFPWHSKVMLESQKGQRFMINQKEQYRAANRIRFILSLTNLYPLLVVAALTNSVRS
jgi:hypothetical protein